MPENGGKQKKLIIEIHFNDWGGTPERTTRNWIEKRLALFMTCTRKSLQLQTSQDFSCYVIYDPASERIIREILDRYVPLPRNIQFVTPRGYYAHVAEDIAGYDCYYRVYLSSDDMYHKDFIRRLHAYTPKIQPHWSPNTATFTIRCNTGWANFSSGCRATARQSMMSGSFCKVSGRISAGVTR